MFNLNCSIRNTATVVLLVLPTLVPSDVGATWELATYSVQHYNGSQCPSSDLSYSHQAAFYFRDKLMNSYGYQSWQVLLDSMVKFESFADPSRDSAGRDYSSGHPNWGADVTDIAMFYGHALYVDSSTSNRYSYLYLGADTHGCELQYSDIPWVNDVLWGNTDLNVGVLEACSTLQEEIQNVYFVGGGSMSMLLGYHGLSYDTQWHVNDFKKWVDTSKYHGLGDNFVDENTRRFGVVFNRDNCAAAVTYGASPSDNSYVYQNSGLKDFKTPTSSTVGRYWVLGRCNPKGGQPT